MRQSVNTTDINTPSGITVKADADRVRISRRYVGSGWGIVIMFWILSLYFVFIGITFKILSTELVFCIVPTITLSLVMFYYLLLWIMNERVIEVNQDTLSSRCEGPIPWPGSDQMIDSTSIKQVYIKEISATRYRTRRYDVYVLTKDRRHEKLVAVPRGNQALYLEQEIERFLGIEDQVVRGEWRPTPYLWEK